MHRHVFDLIFNKTGVTKVMEAAVKTQLNMKTCVNDRWPLSFFLKKAYLFLSAHNYCCFGKAYTLFSTALQRVVSKILLLGSISHFTSAFCANIFFQKIAQIKCN